MEEEDIDCAYMIDSRKSIVDSVFHLVANGNAVSEIVIELEDLDVVFFETQITGQPISKALHTLAAIDIQVQLQTIAFEEFAQHFNMIWIQSVA